MGKPEQYIFVISYLGKILMPVWFLMPSLLHQKLVLIWKGISKEVQGKHSLRRPGDFILHAHFISTENAYVAPNEEEEKWSLCYHLYVHALYYLIKCDHVNGKEAMKKIFILATWAGNRKIRWIGSHTKFL